MFNHSSSQDMLKTTGSFRIVKFLLLAELSVMLICNLILFYSCVCWLKTTQMQSMFTAPGLGEYCASVTFTIHQYDLTLDFIGLIFSNLAFFVGLISLLALDTRFYHNNLRFVFVCTLLVIIVLVFTLTTNYLVFFLAYELLLIPSFFFVYFISPGKQAVQASIYFVVWTQIGSFLVLVAIAYLAATLDSTSFVSLRNCCFSETEYTFLLYFLFFGFGFKVPIWPFHYWITKTHVEAPTGFSIFLSGFLVKSAVYGFYKLTTTLGGYIDTTIFSLFTILGVLDASLKMWGQTDLKKLVAYATIQEMGIIYMVFCWGDTMLLYGGVLFCIAHAFLSSMFFYFVDCINRRYLSRNIVEVNGVLHITPNLGVAILLGFVLFSGLPGTMKFISEIYIFSGLLVTAPTTVVIILIFANFIGLIGFAKGWFNVVFGLSPTKGTKPPKDLSLKEIFIIGLCIFGLFFYGYFLTSVY